MPTWRCPHCGTPQTETARCWVCRRSSTACGTCRHFRRSVAAQLGYCGLDRRRAPLVGDEIRACWESTPALAGALPNVVLAATVTSTGTSDRPARRDFIEIDRGTVPGDGGSVGDVPTTDPAFAAGAEAAMPAATTTGKSEPGWNLWGDLEA